MDAIRVLIVSKVLMFSHGLKSLLTSDPHLELVGEKMDFIEAWASIESLKPDVILWGNKSETEATPQEIVTLLNLQPGLKLISLNLQNNEMWLYQAARTSVVNPQTLIEAINVPLMREAEQGAWTLWPLISGNGDSHYRSISTFSRDGHPYSFRSRVSSVATRLGENYWRAKEVCERAKKTCQASQQILTHVRKARLLRRERMLGEGKILPGRSA